jgi:hypothetical protein
MTYNLFSMLRKVDLVFRSCQSTEQWFVAYKYYRMAKKKFPHKEWPLFEEVFDKHSNMNLKRVMVFNEDVE